MGLVSDMYLTQDEVFVLPRTRFRKTRTDISSALERTWWGYRKKPHGAFSFVHPWGCHSWPVTLLLCGGSPTRGHICQRCKSCSCIHWLNIHSLPRPEKNWKFKEINSFKTRPVLDSSSFVPVPTLTLHIPFHTYGREGGRVVYSTLHCFI
jgi:hypothetical protein